MEKYGVYWDEKLPILGLKCLYLQCSLTIGWIINIMFYHDMWCVHFYVSITTSSAYLLYMPDIRCWPWGAHQVSSWALVNKKLCLHYVLYSLSILQPIYQIVFNWWCTQKSHFRCLSRFHSTWQNRNIAIIIHKSSTGLICLHCLLLCFFLAFLILH